MREPQALGFSLEGSHIPQVLDFTRRSFVHPSHEVILSAMDFLVRESERISCCLTINYDAGVAPHAGAWIETVILARMSKPHLSPPTRGRGLKL